MRCESHRSVKPSVHVLTSMKVRALPFIAQAVVQAAWRCCRSPWKRMPSCNRESSYEGFLCASQGKTHRCQAQGCCVSSRSSSWYRCHPLCRPPSMTTRVLEGPGKKVNLFSHDLLPSEVKFF